MITQNLTVIGVGNMGWAIVQRLLQQGLISKDTLQLSDPTIRPRTERKFDVEFAPDNRTAVKDADIILLAVKPQHVPSVLKEIAPVLKKDMLLISIAAGFPIHTIRHFVGEGRPIVRVMPNLAATVGESMSGWIRTAEVTDEQAEMVKTLLNGIGKEIELTNEQGIDAITAISGSGPAYVLYLVQLLQEAAVELGFREDAAKMLALQTLKGTVALLEESSFDAAALRQQVTSKGGTTEAAFKVLEQQKVGEGFKKAVVRAFERAQELST